MLTRLITTLQLADSASRTSCCTGTLVASIQKADLTQTFLPATCSERSANSARRTLMVCNPMFMCSNYPIGHSFLKTNAEKNYLPSTFTFHNFVIRSFPEMSSPSQLVPFLEMQAITAAERPRSADGPLRRYPAAGGRQRSSESREGSEAKVCTTGSGLCNPRGAAQPSQPQPRSARTAADVDLVTETTRPAKNLK